MKTRSNKPPGNAYAIADDLWALPNAFVVWMLYNPEDLEPINYYAVDCAHQPQASFPASVRTGFRAVKMKDAHYKELSIGQIAGLLGLS